MNILWSEQHSLLISNLSGLGGGTEVAVYKLSKDLRTIISSYTLEEVALAGWSVPGESIILDGGPIWSLAEGAPLGAASRLISSQPSPYGEWRAEVIEYAGCFREWQTSPKSYQHLRLVHNLIWEKPDELRLFNRVEE
jgi:hypothetical protein